MITLDSLVDRTAYCVVRDDSNRESIVMSGAAIKAGWKASRDIQRFVTRSAMQMPGYVAVSCPEGLWLGVWMNTLCPELADPDVVPPYRPRELSQVIGKKAAVVFSMPNQPLAEAVAGVEPALAPKAHKPAAVRRAVPDDDQDIATLIARTTATAICNVAV